MTVRLLALGLLAASFLAPPALGQTAQALFAAQGTPSAHAAHPVGQHSRGCLAGAVQLPETGPTWQAMRLSRNHNWGHPEMIAYIQWLSREAVKVGWRGLYIGDIGQPRGGPVKGHASHQTGLDVDIWFTPPTRLDLSRADRERLSAINVRSTDQRHVNGNWTTAHHRVLATAASDPRTNRIFVTAPVKLQMCADTGGNRAWLRKVRPWWGHNDHFHVRLNCPSGAVGCVDPDPLPEGDGCQEAIWWVTEALEPPDPSAPKPQPKPPLRIADLPKQCGQVLQSQ